MRYKLVTAVTATLAATAFPVKSFKSPFLRGNECVLQVVKSGDFAGGNVTVKTDNSSDGSYSDVRPAATANAATTQGVENFNLTLGDNIEVTAAAVTAGSFDVILLGNT